MTFSPLTSFQNHNDENNLIKLSTVQIAQKPVTNMPIYQPTEQDYTDNGLYLYNGLSSFHL